MMFALVVVYRYHILIYVDNKSTSIDGFTATIEVNDHAQSGWLRFPDQWEDTGTKCQAVFYLHRQKRWFQACNETVLTCTVRQLQTTSLAALSAVRGRMRMHHKKNEPHYIPYRRA